MAGEKQPPQIDQIIPMEPRFRVLPLVSPSVRPDAKGILGRALDFAERVGSHRFDLEPTVPVEQEVFKARHEGRGRIYRQGRKGDAVLVDGSYGKIGKGNRGDVHEVETRWVGTHPGALASFLTKHGEWALVTFTEPTDTPPETLPLPRREKPQIARRLLQRPRRPR